MIINQSNGFKYFSYNAEKQFWDDTGREEEVIKREHFLFCGH